MVFQYFHMNFTYFLRRQHISSGWLFSHCVNTQVDSKSLESWWKQRRFLPIKCYHQHRVFYGGFTCHWEIASLLFEARLSDNPPTDMAAAFLSPKMVFFSKDGGWGPLECLEFQNEDLDIDMKMNFKFEVLVLFCSLSGWGVTVSHSSPVTSWKQHDTFFASSSILAMPRFRKHLLLEVLPYQLTIYNFDK